MQQYILDLAPKANGTIAKINKLDPIKLKSFYRAKEIIDKTERKSTKLEKIFANDMIDKGLISKLYKQLKQFKIKTKKPKQPSF